MMKIKILIGFWVLISLPVSSYAGEVVIPKRALDCRNLETAELDKFNKTELESYYCGNIIGEAKSQKLSNSKSENEAGKTLMKEKTRPKKLKMCETSKTKVRKLYDSKFLSELIDCSKFKGFTKDGEPDIK